MRAATLLAFGAALSSIMCAKTGAAEEAKLRAASFQVEAVSLARPFYRWVEETNRRCAGKIGISVLGPDEIPYELQWHELKQGRIDIYFGPANYYRGALPQGDVFNLSHTSAAEQRRNGAWALLNALHNEHMNAWYLTTLSAGVPFFIYTTKPANGGRFEGLRIRAVPLYEGFLRTLGAEPRYMPASAVHSALEAGTIDGYGWPLWSAGLGWEKFVKYRYGPGFLNTAAPVLANLDRWRALSEEQRQCLTEMAVWIEGEWPSWRAKEDTRQLAMLENAGIEYIDLGAAFAREAEDIYWAMLDKALPDYVRQIKPLVTAAE